MQLLIIFRDLCMQDWVVNNPGGLAADFKKYFDNLPKEELKAGLHCTVPAYADVVISIRIHCFIVHELRSYGVHKFSAKEMAFNILGLMHPLLFNTQVEPSWAD